MGREKEAVSALTAALARASANPFLMSALGAALVRRDNGVTAQARTLFENALGLDPSLGEPKFFFGMAALQAGDNEAAREWWTKAARDLPENDPRRSMAAQFLARETPPIAVQ
jgi:Cytochrome c biogenesis factor